MRRFLSQRIGVGIIGTLLAFSLAVCATGATTSTDLNESEEETSRLIARELAAIRAEVSQLRTGEEHWLDERRAVEVRELVQSVLEDAESRVSSQSDELTAGYDGKAFLASPDGGFRLRIHGFLQERYTINSRDSEPGVDAWTKGFENRRARLFLDGTVERIGYRVRFTAGSGGGFSLDQAYADIPLGDDGLKFRAGQFSLPLFRDDYISADGQLAVDSSVVNQVFNPGTSQGVQLQQSTDRLRFWVAFTDGLRSANTRWDDPDLADYAFTGRVELRGGGGDWSRFDIYTSYPGSDLGWMIGLSGHYAYGAVDSTGQRTEVSYVTADATVGGDGWNVALLGVLVYDDIGLAEGRAIDSGVQIQGSVYLTEQVELFARFDILLESDHRPAASEPFQTWTAGVTWYAVPRSQRVKLTTNFVYFPEATTNTLVEALGGSFAAQGLLPSSNGGQWAIQTQLQLQF